MGETVATGLEKFACSIPMSLNRIINAVATERDCGRNDAVKHLVGLALANEDHPPMPMSGEKSIDCSLQAEKGFFATTIKYRMMHGLPNKKSAFLRDALTTGRICLYER